MKKWKDLGLISQVIIGVLFFGAAIIMPELMFVIDLGGLELVFGFLVLYFNSIIAWFSHKLNAIKSVLKIAVEIVLNSSVAKPKILTVHAVYCALVLFGSGSLLFSMSFFFQGILINAV
jgi:hypothetical protein